MTTETNQIDAQADNPTATMLGHWQERLSLSESRFAAYLGVPSNTLRNWKAGTRQPPAVAHRLFNVLQMIEAFAPEIAQNLTNDSE